MEQARLLKLLRSIHPNSIVDQLCKGLSYFGGIPGAPPPPNGIFPMSEAYNGTGALFVNWLSEIFPPVYPAPPDYQPESVLSPGFPSREVAQPNHSSFGAHTADGVAGTNGPKMDAVVMPKRKRGRPKGSKSSKPRKDKGIKKGPNALRGVVGNGKAANEEVANGEEDSREPTETADIPQVEITPQHTSNSKRRGRPPGSKNKPKPQTCGSGVTPIASAGEASSSMESSHDRNAFPAPSSAAPQPHSLESQAQSRAGREYSHPQGVRPFGVAWDAPQSYEPDPEPTSPSLPVAPVPSQAAASLKRKLSNTSAQAALYSLDHRVSQRQATASPANSQDQTNLAQPRKRQRASNGAASHKRLP